jgi:hypothetical protein
MPGLSVNTQQSAVVRGSAVREERVSLGEKNLLPFLRLAANARGLIHGMLLAAS